jgi:hypothetical protein
MQEMQKKLAIHDAQKIALYLQQHNSIHPIQSLQKVTCQEEKNRYSIVIDYIVPIVPEYHFHWKSLPVSFISDQELQQIIINSSAHNELFSEMENNSIVGYLSLGRVNAICKSPGQKLQRVVFSQEKPKYSYQYKPTLQNILSQTAVQKIQQPKTIPIYLFLSVSIAIVGVLVCCFTRRKKYILVFFFLLSSASLFFPGKIAFGTQQIVDIQPKNMEEIFLQLHQNIYRAFDYHDKKLIYQTLEQSIAGDIFVSIYQNFYQNHLGQQEKQVIIQDVSVAKAKCSYVQNQTVFIRCQWRVIGLVFHKGHIHHRQYQYHGIFQLQPIEQQWKITQYQILQQQHPREENDLDD